MFVPASHPNGCTKFDETWYTGSSLADMKYCKDKKSPKKGPQASVGQILQNTCKRRITLNYITPPASSCLEPFGSFPDWMDGGEFYFLRKDTKTNNNEKETYTGQNNIGNKTK
ncbi:hypothetical protein AVEN_249342-1 [Araneus ventricosus]|uniref:Uncharacterized protein n=1 Tax=Araneus ventricosus TaxID=182803 RepID=A0A4Y2PND2_ARAVE|nr:hypothetical protein AVEN_249342-1 [Araneus ventricosus]